MLRPWPTAVFVVASFYVQLVRYHSLSQRTGLCGCENFGPRTVFAGTKIPVTEGNACIAMV